MWKSSFALTQSPACSPARCGSNSTSVRAVSARCRWRRQTRAGDETSPRDAGRPQSRRQPDRSRRDQLAREGLRTKTQPGESEPRCEIVALGRRGLCRASKRRPFHVQLERRHVRPAVRAPRHRREKRLAAQVMVAARRRADPEKHGPRAPVVELDQVGVAGGLDRVPGTVPVGEERPVRRWDERAVRPAAPRHDDGVAVARAALRRQQVEPAAAAIQVRRLGPDAAGAPPDHARLAGEGRHSARPRELGLVDEGMIGVGARTVAGVVHAIVEKRERGVDPVGVQPAGVRPGAARMRSR